MIFWIYLIALYPLFLAAFVHLTRKTGDVNTTELVLMAVFAALPIIREVTLVFLLATVYNRTVFKQYEE